MTQFEVALLDLIREAMRQKDEPMQRRILEMEKNIHERIDKYFSVICTKIDRLEGRVVEVEKNER